MNLIFQKEKQHRAPVHPCEGFAISECDLDEETRCNHGLAGVATFARLAWMQ
jgi:hypothetical protein